MIVKYLSYSCKTNHIPVFLPYFPSLSAAPARIHGPLSFLSCCPSLPCAVGGRVQIFYCTPGCIPHSREDTLARCPVDPSSPFDTHGRDCNGALKERIVSRGEGIGRMQNGNQDKKLNLHIDINITFVHNLNLIHHLFICPMQL